MKPTRLLPHLVTLILLANIAPAQTATWLNQSLSDPSQFLSWTNGANWSTGTVPNSITAVAQLRDDSSFYNGVPIANHIQILNTAITLAQLQYQSVYPFFYNTYFPSLTIGGTGASETGSLEFTGAGLIASNSLYSAPSILLHNARLIFSNRSQLAISTSILTGAGNNQIWFRDNSSANGLILSLGSGSRLDVTDRARLQSSTVYFNDGEIGFSDQSSLQNSYFAIYGPGLIRFSDQTTLLNPYFYFYRPASATDSIIRFSGDTQIQGGSVYSSGISGTIEFTDQADSSNFNIYSYVRQLDVTGATTGTGTTGRQRATSSTLAPTSVVADDARTISLNRVTVQDLLLGSNRLEVGSGYIGNIRDSGGAYLSTAGENLIGGGLIKVGQGYLVLNSPAYNPADNLPSYNTFTGLTTIQEGTLYLYNRAASVNVESAGRLVPGSLGFVDGRLHNAGIVRPSSSAFRIMGDYTQTPTGRLEIYAGDFTTLNVMGTATLAGQLNISTPISFFPNQAPGTATLEIIKANQIAGSFDTMASKLILDGRYGYYQVASPRITSTLDYQADRVILQIEFLPIAVLGSTPAQKALGAYLDVLHQPAYYFNYPNNYLTIERVLNSVSTKEEFLAILDNFSPDRYGPVLEHGFSTALARRTALDRLTSSKAVDNQTAIFAEGGQRKLIYETVDGLPQANALTDSWLAGGRWRNGRLIFGVYVASEKTGLTLDSAGSQAKIESVEPGAFARFDAGNYFVEASAGFSRDRYQLRRVVVDYVYFNPLVVTNTAEPRGKRTDWSIATGFIWRKHSWSLTPFAGFTVSDWRINDFTETHSSFINHNRLTINGWSHTSHRARAGLKIAGALFDGRLQPYLVAAWWHEFEKGRSIPTSFGGAPSSYLAPGRPADRDLYQLSLALDCRLNRHASLTFNTSFQDSDYSHTSSDFTVGFRYEF